MEQSDEELARQLQLEFDSEMAEISKREKTDFAFAQELSENAGTSTESSLISHPLIASHNASSDNDLLVPCVNDQKDETGIQKITDNSIIKSSDLHNAEKDNNGIKPLCKYASSCYRKNPSHLEEFFHPLMNKSALNSPQSRNVELTEKTNSSSNDNTSEPVKKRRKVASAARSFSERLNESAPMFLFLNKSFSVKETHTDPFSLVFPDLLSPSLGTLIESVQLNYMVDLDFLMEQYQSVKADDKPMLVMHGQMEKASKSYPNVTCIQVHLPFQYGTHHSKMMLLQYEDGLRVVIHTANLVADDWYEKTQGFWISPKMPPLSENRVSLLDGDSPTRFKRDLVDYLLSYKVPDLTKWSHTIRKYDFSVCNAVLIASIPGYHSNEVKDNWGHMRVRKILQKYAAHDWKQSVPVVLQCSSIGSLGKDAKSWLSGEFGFSLTGSQSLNANPPPVHLVYPSEEDVRTSNQGWQGGSCLPYSSQTHAKQTWLLEHMHHWRSSRFGRTRAMPHIKSYTRISNDQTQAQYFLLTSANLSKAAWGQLQKQNSQLFIRSYEVGILLLPKFVIGKDKFSLETKENESFLRLPYDYPLTHYVGDAKPWFMDTPKMNTDVLGCTSF